MAEWEAIKIHDVIQDINDNTVVLPVIQRNLVWDEEKMELLFDSLLKGNSFGGIMALEEEKGNHPLFAFRQFSKEGELHDSDLPSALDHNTTLIIDGQQRLQSFFMGLQGGVNGKNLYFNLFSQGDFEFEFTGQISELPSSRKEDGTEISMLWYQVTNLYERLRKVGNDDRRVAQEIIQARNMQNETEKELVYANIKSFERAIFGVTALGISKVYIDHTNLDGERRRMVELFRRLNDGGTRLSALDLAASALKGFDYRLEVFLRRDIPKFSDIGFGADEVIKLIFLLQDNYTREVTDISKQDADFAVKNAPRILKSLEVVRQLLVDSGLYEFYRGGGRSIIPLYFLAYHVFYKPASIETLSAEYSNFDANNPDFTNIKRWLYLSLLNGVFSRGKGWIPYVTGIKKILSTVSRYKGELFPAAELFTVYESHPLVFSQEVSEARLNNWDMNFVFYLIYDQHNLSGRDIDHVQPRSLLEAANVPAQKIHFLGNYQLLDESTNRGDKRAKQLADWLKDWKETELGSYIQRHLIPQDRSLWLMENFDAFLSLRSRMIVEKIKKTIPNQSVPSQISQPMGNPTRLNSYGSIEGAANISREERDPESWLKSLADKNGCGQEFTNIIEAAREVGLYARFQNNWWIVQLTPMGNHSLGLFDLAPDLGLWIFAPAVARYINFPEETVKEKLNLGERIPKQDVPRWIENFKSLFEKSK
jgi:hypothetical protein